jgi:hypothetical protein
LQIIRREKPEVTKLKTHILHLKGELAKLSMSDNYVQYVKMERKILAAEMKIKELDGGTGIEKKTEHFLTELIAKYALRVLASVSLLVLLFIYGKMPVIVLEDHISLKPFDILWNYSEHKSSISARGWAAISCLAIRTIRKQILNI